MKIKRGFELRTVCGEKIVHAAGVENIDYSKIVDLNESAAFLFEQMAGREFDIDDMVAALTGEYEVSTDVARRDCIDLAQQWREAGFVE